MSDLRAQRKILHLPSTPLTPEVVLARTLEKCPSIKNVAVMIEWDDTDVSCDWSNMRMRDLVYLERCLQQRIADFMAGDLLDSTGDPDKDLA